MNRRRFLWEGIAGGAIALGAGGFLFIRRNQARSAVASSLLNDALPRLTANSGKELNALPVRAREEIKRYFHGKCLNVEGFVSRICSTEFTERLGRCQTQEERERCFLLAFFSRVATEAEILNQIETIADDIGSELDSAWSAYCVEMSAKWNTHLQCCGTRLTADELTNRLSSMIKGELGQAARHTTTGNQQPAVGETIGKIGASAVLLLPLVRFGALGLKVGIPVFVILAAKHLWDYAMSQLEDRRGDYQMAISRRLALLGNRVGTEFEREVRLRLTDLHTWQERAVRETAMRLAEERVGLIYGAT
jgi:hypothetical protein